MEGGRDCRGGAGLRGGGGCIIVFGGARRYNSIFRPETFYNNIWQIILNDDFTKYSIGKRFRESNRYKVCRKCEGKEETRTVLNTSFKIMRSKRTWKD